MPLHNLHDPNISRDLLRQPRIPKWNAQIAEWRKKKSNPPIDFTEIDLSERDLGNVDLLGIPLTMADLFHSTMNDADLRYADLTGANLAATTLENVDARQAVFEDANLRDAVWNDVDLRDAKLATADLRGTKFTNVDFCGADLSDVVVDSGTKFNGCKFDKDTKLPDVPQDHFAAIRQSLGGHTARATKTKVRDSRRR